MPIYYTCPGYSENTFQRYINILTRVQVANDVGGCKNKKSCGYHFYVNSYARLNNIHTIKDVSPSFIPHEKFLKSLCNYSDNNLFLYLAKEFGAFDANKAMELLVLERRKAFPAALYFGKLIKKIINVRGK